MVRELFAQQRKKTQRVKIAKRPLVRHNAPPQRFLGMTHNVFGLGEGGDFHH
jgi:hypothetical protein